MNCDFSYYCFYVIFLARIHFKILILVFKAIHGLAPQYISDLISVRPKSFYNLISNSSLSLKSPKEKMQKVTLCTGGPLPHSPLNFIM